MLPMPPSGWKCSMTNGRIIPPDNRLTGPDAVSVAALRRQLLALLDVIRVYTRRPGDKSFDDTPVPLPASATIGDLARDIHQDLHDRFVAARVWRSGRLASDHASREFPLEDGDQVEIHSR